MRFALTKALLPAFAVASALAVPALAQQHQQQQPSQQQQQPSQQQQGGMQGMDHSRMQGMDHSRMGPGAGNQQMMRQHMPGMQDGQNPPTTGAPQSPQQQGGTRAPRN